jgi:probable addiction module antidote protein
MTETFAPFDVADYLDSEDLMAKYLAAAAEDSDPDIFLAALGDVARARGMAHVANEAGLGRESLYKALSPGAHPRFETISAVLKALGMKMSITPARPLEEKSPVGL